MGLIRRRRDGVAPGAVEAAPARGRRPARRRWPASDKRLARKLRELDARVSAIEERHRARDEWGRERLRELEAGGG